MSDFKQVFFEEANELLVDLETYLLELEKQPKDQDCVGRIFRALHTIKGSGAMFGFDKVSAFTHNLENVFDLVRNQKISVTPELIDLSLKSRDYIQRLLISKDDSDTELLSKGTNLSLLIQKFLPFENDAQSDSPVTENTPVKDTGSEINLYYIYFAPFPELFKMGTNPLVLMNELNDMGEMYVKADLQDLPELNDLDPELCFTKWTILLATSQDELAIRDVFMFVEDIAQLAVYQLCSADNISLDLVSTKLSASRLYDKDELLTLIDPLIKVQKTTKADQSNGSAVKQTLQKDIPTLRVASEKLDSLVDLVGEFVTMQAHFSQLAKKENSSETVLIAEQMERLTNELRDNVMSLRMQTIGTVFGKFRRLVRDLASDLGKKIVLETEGEQTELDKSVIEKLNDPIMHIIRNSIDHGIEDSETRLKNGKPKEGIVKMMASHSGAHVVIKIVDDGKGLNKEAILKKGIERSLVGPNQELTEQEIYNLVLTPGFSTAEGVTKVSGRGVGMDVVKKTIDALGGNIILSSEPGKGTEIALVLPLTLAIVEGLLVTIQGEHFIFPLSSVEECVELNRKEADAIFGRHLTKVRNELVPYLRLGDYFELDGEIADTEQIVIANINSQKFGFVVDRVIGSYQTVIKSLGQMYKQVKGISGATILGDGSVALIVDLIQLEQAARIAADKIKSDRLVAEQ